MAAFFLDGITLGNSTAVFTNAELTTLAPDQFYSDNTISREQVSGKLLPQQVCPSCAVSCGETINVNGTTGIYTLDFDAGTAIGAMRITFNPASIPDGFKATFNSVVYNKFSSPNVGRLESTVNNAATYIGSSSANCGLPKTTLNVPIFNYIAASNTFVNTGVTQTETVVAGQVQLGAPPGASVMVIPKTTASPSIVSLNIAGVCTSTAWGVSIDCPIQLTGFSASVLGATVGTVCPLTLGETFYNVIVTGSAGNPALHDFVFSDVNGSIALLNVYYKISGGRYMRVIEGIITEIDNCPSGLQIMIMSDCLTGNNQSAYDDFSNSVGDVVQYRIGLPGSGAVYCATITSFTGVTADSTLVNGIVYECSDSIHCLQ